jgi:hypothetical protein
MKIPFSNGMVFFILGIRKNFLHVLLTKVQITHSMKMAQFLHIK